MSQEGVAEKELSCAEPGAALVLSRGEQAGLWAVGCGLRAVGCGLCCAVGCGLWAEQG